jgi:phosphopantetheinyl transferase
MPLIFTYNPIPEATLAIWHITEDIAQLSDMVFLHPEEEFNLRSYKNELRKKQWLGVRALVQMIIPDRPMIGYDEFGKPFFSNGVAHLSISHSGQFVAVILSGKIPVGIDIEVPRDKILRVADRFLAPSETPNLQEPEYLNKLMIHWCAKEALYKMAGIPGLDLQNEIVISRFDYLCGTWGTCRGTIRHGSRSATFPVYFLVDAGFILAYTLNREYTDK